MSVKLLKEEEEEKKHLHKPLSHLIKLIDSSRSLREERREDVMWHRSQVWHFLCIFYVIKHSLSSISIVEGTESCQTVCPHLSVSWKAELLNSLFLSMFSSVVCIEVLLQPVLLLFLHFVVCCLHYCNTTKAEIDYTVVINTNFQILIQMKSLKDKYIYIYIYKLTNSELADEYLTLRVYWEAEPGNKHNPVMVRDATTRKTLHVVLSRRNKNTCRSCDVEPPARPATQPRFPLSRTVGSLCKWRPFQQLSHKC